MSKEKKCAGCGSTELEDLRLLIESDTHISYGFMEISVKDEKKRIYDLVECKNCGLTSTYRRSN